MAAISTIRKLGIKVVIKNKTCAVYGRGVEGYRYKKNLTLNAQNSGTLGRLILGLLINTPHPIKLNGDKSLSKRDFKRITDPLTRFGAVFNLTNNKNLPLKSSFILIRKIQLSPKSCLMTISDTHFV